MQYWSNDLIERIHAQGKEIIHEPTKIFGICRIARTILTDRQLEVFVLRYKRGFTMERTGKRMGITPVAVLKLEKRLIIRLQADLFYLEILCRNHKTRDSESTF